MRARILAATVAATALVGAVALPAEAAVVALPVDLEGGGPGGSLWDGFDNDGYYCQDSEGFSLGEAELDPGDVTPIGNQGDAFDDAFMLADAAGGESAVYFVAPGDQVDLVGNTVSTDVAPFGGLQVAITQTAFEDAARLRTIYTFVNPSDADVTHTYQTETDLGSDGSTTIGGTSSGDLSWTAADRWLVTLEGPAEVDPPSDPVVTTVTQGSGAVQSPDLVSFDCSVTAPTPSDEVDQDVLRSVWTMSVPAGQTRHVVLFTELNQTTDDAVAAAEVYGAPGADSPLFAGVPVGELANIVNWDFGAPTPPPTPPTTPPSTAVPTTASTPAAAQPAQVTPTFTG